jgi:hypothetical protein
MNNAREFQLLLDIRNQNNVVIMVFTNGTEARVEVFTFQTLVNPFAGFRTHSTASAPPIPTNY